MPRRYLIEEFLTFSAVRFYTIRDDEKDESETDYFIARFSDPDHKAFRSGFEAAIGELVSLIEQIGIRGLDSCSLRFENSAFALPPKSVRHAELSNFTTHSPLLRLYCIPLPPPIMILCGGGIKSSQQNDDSSDLLAHFRLADRIGKKINQKLAHQEIWTEFDELVGDLECWI